MNAKYLPTDLAKLQHNVQLIINSKSLPTNHNWKKAQNKVLYFLIIMQEFFLLTKSSASAMQVYVRQESRAPPIALGMTMTHPAGASAVVTRVRRSSSPPYRMTPTTLRMHPPRNRQFAKSIAADSRRYKIMNNLRWFV